jgi:LPS O-antigen subunit length determinant protein (WzzB/FepE family)
VIDDKISIDSDNKVDIAALLRMMWGGRITIAISAIACTVLALSYALLATPPCRAEISVIEANG